MSKITVPAPTMAALKAATSATKVTGILSIIISILRPIIAVLTPTIRDMLHDTLIDFYNKAKATENPWDDFLAEILLRLLGIDIPA